MYKKSTSSVDIQSGPRQTVKKGSAGQRKSKDVRGSVLIMNLYDIKDARVHAFSD